MKHLLTQLLGGQAQKRIFISLLLPQLVLFVLRDYNRAKVEASEEQRFQVTL